MVDLKVLLFDMPNTLYELQNMVLLHLSYIDMYKGINLDYYGMDDFDENDEEKKEYLDEISKEEKMQESMMYLDYLDKLNNRNNLIIFDNIPI